MTNRRQFLNTSFTTLASIAGPNLLLGQKPGSLTPVIGEGEHQYRCHHNWPNLPDGHAFGGQTHGIAVDSAGHIHVTHYGSPGSVFVFDAAAKFIRSYAPELMQKGIAQGHGIDIRREAEGEFAYLSPSHPTLGFAKYTIDGELVWIKKKTEIPYYQNPKAPFRPTNISFSPDGGFHLGDGYGSSMLHRFDKDGKFLKSFGGKGTEPGQFQTPHGHWLDEREKTPLIVVADRANKRLQWLTLDGEPVRMLEGLLFPADIDIQGDLLLVPDLHARISIFDKQNRPIIHLGDDPAWRSEVLANNFAMRSQPNRWQPGKFVHPHDACFDAEGNIFVAEWVKGGRVTKLEKVS